jgi:hypothetical protein
MNFSRKLQNNLKISGKLQLYGKYRGLLIVYCRKKPQ